MEAYAHKGIYPRPGHPLQEYTPERVRALKGVETKLKKKETTKGGGKRHCDRSGPKEQDTTISPQTREGSVIHRAGWSDTELRCFD